ncbi:AraC family transcriptional regulator [Paraflavitalea soli]|uniref:AraC family transcriptional regulator n=1 Tax=Paraflavitalea soli TaxID=2315862 RepID=A0A3B7MPU6_9BACT|nr:AraC family transcriptional regulator [Paraflavitalea soli]AXY75339.1 AraC family transcriptional regulator [Paraflavitalea soli]
MYFTSLPDHTRPGFDEALHFSKFRKHNIIFNAFSSNSHCDDHVGCLSFKTLLTGEEWYGINNYRLAVRPGQFLILNDEQNYSCSINNGEKAKVLSVFFKKEFATAVFQDTLNSEETLLDNPFNDDGKTLEFFQTLNDITPALQQQLMGLIAALDSSGYSENMVDEYLVFLLRYLIHTQKAASKQVKNVHALKANTRTEVYKRLCIARDILHSSYMDNPDLPAISALACLSVPQLVRQFKAVFHTTPHQYLTRIKLERAAELLKHTDKPVHEITWLCGFENVSAFCRAFKSAFGIQPLSFRKKGDQL